jgi:putative ABC transport system permease protein
MSALHNYLVTALRVLAANPMHSAINISGLAAGLACCLLIFLFVRDELSYDRWLPDADRIYRLESTFFIPGREPLAAVQSPGPARAALEKDYPDAIEAATRILETRHTVELGDRNFSEIVLEVDPEFFDVFALPLVHGDRAAALADHSSLVLTETTARKFFGAVDVVGRTLTLTHRSTQTFRITGVLRDVPRNSHLEIGMLARFNPEKYVNEPWVSERWTSVNMYNYFKFRSPAAAGRVSATLGQFADRNVDFQIPELEGHKASDLLKFDLTPVPRIHLHTTKLGGLKPSGDIRTVVAFATVAVLILVIACINFMNLATARSLQRAREVAIRKVVGAHRRQLVLQFLGESMLITTIALVIAAVAARLALPWFNGLVHKELDFSFVSDPVLPAAAAGLALFVGVVGGLYPAFILSRFRPALVLKANQSGGAEGSATLRAALVVIQFSISIALIAATLIVYAQTHYARNMNMGFERDQRVLLRGVGSERARPVQIALLQELERLPGVMAVARASDAVPQDSNNNTLVHLPDVPSDELLVIETMTVDHRFLPALGVQAIAGRLFSPDFMGDVMPPDPDLIEDPIHAGVILNRRAVRQLGFGDPQAAIGRSFQVSVGFRGEPKRADVTVVGVVEDMHFRSVHNEISPMLFYFGDHQDDFWYFLLHVQSSGLPATLQAIDDAWKRLLPDVPVRRSFVDEEFAKLYAAEEERMKMFASLSVFAVFVACLGLFGLASYSAERRTREIGIRKVLGASVGDIVRLLLWQFSRPVLLANVIAWPAAWYVSRSWLENFSYRIDLTPLPFAVAGAAALLVAAATVTLHARRISLTSPVRALRNE